MSRLLFLAAGVFLGTILTMLLVGLRRTQTTERDEYREATDAAMNYVPAIRIAETGNVAVAVRRWLEAEDDWATDPYTGGLIQ